MDQRRVSRTSWTEMTDLALDGVITEYHDRRYAQATFLHQDRFFVCRHFSSQSGKNNTPLKCAAPHAYHFYSSPSSSARSRMRTAHPINPHVWYEYIYLSTRVRVFTRERNKTLDFCSFDARGTPTHKHVQHTTMLLCVVVWCPLTPCRPQLCVHARSQMRGRISSFYVCASFFSGVSMTALLFAAVLRGEIHSRCCIMYTRTADLWVCLYVERQRCATSCTHYIPQGALAWLLRLVLCVCVCMCTRLVLLCEKLNFKNAFLCKAIFMLDGMLALEKYNFVCAFCNIGKRHLALARSHTHIYMHTHTFECAR